MAEFAAMAVSAAGQVAGGAAAQALMGKDPSKSGGGVANLSTSAPTIKNDRSGISSAVTVNADNILGYFQHAADSQAAGYQTGLNYYLNSLKTASKQVQDGYLDANSTLKPLSQASNNALNEQLQMMGMAPISATISHSDRMNNVGGKYTDLATSMSAAENISDPKQRAIAKQNIMNQYNTLSDTTGIQAEINKQQALLSKATAITKNVEDNPDTFYGQQDKYNQAVRDKNNAQGTLNSLQSQLSAAQDINKQAGSVINNWSQNYADTIGAGYTGEQATDKLRATPGYQFQMQEGTKAIERSQGARGMYNSGNTQLALQTYGQGLADQTYQQYMANLSGIVNQGSGATSNIAANESNQGQVQASLSQSGGQAQMKTAYDIANSQATADYAKGNTVLNVALANQQALNQARGQAYAQSAQSANSGLAAGVALNGQALNNQIQQGQLGLAQSQFAYQVYQNQNTGAGYQGAYKI